MQQVPKPQQGIYGRIAADLGEAYPLHTPEALREAMRRGAGGVFHPYKAGPFYLMLPINTQPQSFELNLASLPQRPEWTPQAPAPPDTIDRACALTGPKTPL